MRGGAHIERVNKKRVKREREEVNISEQKIVVDERANNRSVGILVMAHYI